MERGQESRRPRYKVRRKAPVHWCLELLAYIWAAVLVFAIGMVLGGLFSRDSVGAGKGSRAVPAEGVSTEGWGDAQYAPGREDSSIRVVYIDQREDYPTGCESVTAVMALLHAGVYVPVDEFIDNYLPKSQPPQPDSEGVYHAADPNQAYLGDPRTEEGWGCYAPVIQSAVEEFLESNEQGDVSVENLTGQPLEMLCEDYVDQGTPVIVWATVDMAEPNYSVAISIDGTEEVCDWISPEHCLLLVGENEECYVFNDPMKGREVAYGKGVVETAYEAMGRQALAIC